MILCLLSEQSADRLQSQQIAFLAETADLSDADRSDDRFMAEGLTSMDIGHVHLYTGLTHRGDSIPYGIAVVGA